MTPSRRLSRRTLLKQGLAASLSAACLPAYSQTAEAAVEQAHTEIWRRFIDKYHIMIDFADMDGSVSLPTPEECRAGKPNALGWWSPIENGAMFNGMYMDAAVNRWRHTKAEADAAKARRLMEGLLHLASISEVRGFVGRGVSTDGKSHYPMGSNDQTYPWFNGLWLYLESGLATPEERRRIVEKLVITAEAIVALKWQMPAEAPFGIRGGFGSISFEGAPRLLFVCKMMHAVTGDARWDVLYREALQQRDPVKNLTRLEYCEKGMEFENGRKHSWTSCNGVSAIRALWELEKDEALRAAYARGLEASATLAFESLPLAEKFDHTDPAPFEMDWRVMNTQWQPQKTEQEAQALAQAQLREFHKVAPRRFKETDFVREPTSAAWIVTLAPDRNVLKSRAEAVRKVIAHYDYSRLYYSQFFWVESAWWRLQGD